MGNEILYIILDNANGHLFQGKLNYTNGHFFQRKLDYKHRKFDYNHDRK